MRTRTLAVFMIVAMGTLNGFAQSNSSGMVDVIVRYHQAPTQAHHNRVTERGGQLKHSLDIIRAAHYSVPVDRVSELANDPDVDQVMVDHELHAMAPPPGPDCTRSAPSPRPRRFIFN